jgi:hypothetical protein
MSKELTKEELAAFKTVGIIAENWFAILPSKGRVPIAIFNNDKSANDWMMLKCPNAIMEPWPMIIKDLRKGDHRLREL